jgi:hypothetical protein
VKYPRVYQCRVTHDWVAVYEPGVFQSFPSWREAVDSVLTVQRVRHVAADAMRGLR